MSAPSSGGLAPIPHLVSCGLRCVPKRAFSGSGRIFVAGRGPFDAVNPVYALLALNAAVFAVAAAAPFWDKKKREGEIEARRLDVFRRLPAPSHNVSCQALINRHMILSNRALAEGRYHTLFTSAATHFSLSHLLFNSMALFTFSQNVQEILGARRFLGLYAVGALASSGAQSLFNVASHRYDQGTVGASGAILAVTAFSCAMMPGGRVHVYGVLPVPNWAFVVGLVGWSVFSMAAEMDESKKKLTWSEPGVAHAGHLGGAVAGLAYFLALRRGRLR